MIEIVLKPTQEVPVTIEGVVLQDGTLGPLDGPGTFSLISGDCAISSPGANQAVIGAGSPSTECVIECAGASGGRVFIETLHLTILPAEANPPVGLKVTVGEVREKGSV